MTRAATVTLVLMLVGCRPPSPPMAETRAEPPKQAPPAPARGVDVVDVIEEPDGDAPVHVAVERGPKMGAGVAPPGVGASATACEQSCGEVHDCALLDRAYTPAAAAAIELGCVRACLSTPERATLFGCGRPSAIEPGACGQFLTCVDAAWPGEGDGAAVIQPPGSDPHLGSDPCARVCDLFARCWNPATTPEQIDQCAEQCRQDLDAEAERAFGRCADLPECADIMTCVAETPKAT